MSSESFKSFVKAGKVQEAAELYSTCLNSRERHLLRSSLSQILSESQNKPNQVPCVISSLEVMRWIFSGLDRLSLEESTSVLCDVLLPLLQTPGWYQYDRQIPMIEPYFKALSQTVHTVLEISDSPMESIVVLYILDRCFPKPAIEANTPKEILLLNELRKIVASSSQTEFDKYCTRLVSRLCKAIQQDNSQLAETALNFWRKQPSGNNTEPSDHGGSFARLMRKHYADPNIVQEILCALYRGGVLHWNETVNRMTLGALKSIISEIPSAVLAAACARLVPSPGAFSLARQNREHARPMAHEFQASSKSNLGLTGVAPWAKAAPQSIPGLSPKESPAGKEQTISSDGTDRLNEYIAALESVVGDQKLSMGTAETVASAVEEEESCAPAFGVNLKFHHIVFGRPLGEGANAVVYYGRLVDRAASGSKPDTVGNMSGTVGNMSGAVGNMSGISKWSEVAVKKVTYENMKRNGYAHVVREIAILSCLSGHPCVTNLVSALRWRDGVYIVLECGHYGDLHTYVTKHGPLNVEEILVIAAQAISGLRAIHGLGFVFGDLKPENIVISSTRVCKLTDFGGCRPVTDTARRLLQSAASRTLSALYNGDWDEVRSDESLASANIAPPTLAEVVGTDSYEGTLMYLPPEAAPKSSHSNTSAGEGVRSQGPTFAYDAFALGMLLVFMSVGKPVPLQNRLAVDFSSESSVSDIRSAKIVDFDPTAKQDSGPMQRIHSTLRQTVLELLSADPVTRMSVESFATELESTHQIAIGTCCSVVSKEHLTKASAVHPLASARTVPVVDSDDALWTRRQLSIVWSAARTDEFDADSGFTLQGVEATRISVSPPVRTSSDPILFR